LRKVLWILQLIEKIYEVDPLTIRIIDFVEDREVIKAILKHLGLLFIKLFRDQRVYSKALYDGGNSAGDPTGAVPKR